MTLDKYSFVWTIDHCYPLSKTNLSIETDMTKATNRINLRPMYSSENIAKGDKIDHRLYLLQRIKLKYFLKLNEEGLKECFY